jgi:hypothetical protein
MHAQTREINELSIRPRAPRRAVPISDQPCAVHTTFIVDERVEAQLRKKPP